MIDRLLYRFGIVRRSVHDELREAAEAMQTEWFQYRNAMDDYLLGKKPTVKKSPEFRKFKLIQGGKS